MAKKKSPPTNGLRLEYRSPAELAENPRNWRRHPDTQLAALTDVIAEVGWAGACLYNERTERLIDGHARQKVALAQGADKVPVLIGSWDEAQEAKILATLDPLAAMAESDAAALDALLRDVQTGSEALSTMLADLAGDAGLEYGRPTDDPTGGGDDFDATPEEGPCRVAKGDLWLIDGGKHRLLCGDSTNAADVARVMGGEKAGLCFTSPPYAQQRVYTKEITDWDGLMQGVFANLPMTDDGQVLVNLGIVHRDGEWWPYWDGWIEWMRTQGWRRFGWYVWDQGYGLPGDWNGRLSPSHEFIFHFNKQTKYPAKTKDKKPENIKVCGGTQRRTDGDIEAKHSPDAGLATHKRPDSVVRVFRQQARVETGGHPAPFSVAFAAEMIEPWEAEIGYEPFCGSGTSIIAASRLSRRCFGLELEPRYCDVILRREAEGLTVEKSA